MDAVREHIITIDMRKPFCGKAPRFFQHDANQLTINVLDNGQTANFSNVDEVYLQFKRNDGTIFTRKVNPIKNNISYRLQNEEMTCEGYVEIVIQAHGENERISSDKFEMLIQKIIEPRTS